MGYKTRAVLCYEFEQENRVIRAAYAHPSVPLSHCVKLAKYGYVGNAWVEPSRNSTEGKWIVFMLVAQLPTEGQHLTKVHPVQSHT